jgi:transcriptional regulator with XRE-family HTH domain
MTILELGEKIRSIRKEKKWSQDDLEKYSGITKRTISKIENGFIDEVGIKKIGIILDLLGYEFSLRLKDRPRTLDELRDDK